MTSDLPLSFGIEVEVVIFTVQTTLGEFLLTGERTGHHNTLSQVCNIFQANDVFMHAPGVHGDDFEIWSVVHDFSIHMTEPGLNRVRQTGKFAQSVGDMSDNLRNAPIWPAPERALINYESFEFRSPILLFNEEGFNEVRKFMKVLQEKIPAAINFSCGLHVHVGHLGGRGYTLQDAKRVLQAMVIGEFQLSQLNESSRAFYSGYCELNSRAFRLEHRGDSSRLFDLIEECDSITAVRNIATTSLDTSVRHKFWACNLLGLENSNDANQTIEFRTHEGTLDTERILAWADFCCSLVSRCKSPENMDFLKAITFSVPIADFLQALDLGKFADGRLLVRNHSLEEYLYARDEDIPDEDDADQDDEHQDDELRWPYRSTLPQ